MKSIPKTNIMKYAIALALSMFSTCIFANLGSYTPAENENLLFSCNCNVNNFEQSSIDYATPIISKTEFGGSKWQTLAFQLSNSVFKTGIKGLAYTAKIFSEEAIPDAITTATLYVRVDLSDQLQYLNGIYLEVDDNSSFEHPTRIDAEEIPSNTTLGGEIIFKISEPKQNQFYRYNIDFRAGSVNNWISASFFSLYTEKPKVYPDFNPHPSESGKYTLTSLYGDLHVLLYEYDLTGNLVNEIISDNSSASSESVSIKRVIAPDNTTWTNRVAQEGEQFTISAPETNKTYYLLRAKSVSDEWQSEERKEIITNEGVVTMVENLAEDISSKSVEWYTLQGIKVTNPSHGIYICKTNNKIKKVNL